MEARGTLGTLDAYDTLIVWPDTQNEHCRRSSELRLLLSVLLLMRLIVILNRYT